MLETSFKDVRFDIHRIIPGIGVIRIVGLCKINVRRMNDHLYGSRNVIIGLSFDKIQ